MSIDLKDQHSPFRLDGKTEDEFFAEPLPHSVTVTLTEVVAALLQVAAYREDRTPDYIAARLLHEWAAHEAGAAARLLSALSDDSQTRKEGEPRSEMAYRRKVIAALCGAAIDARGEVQTESGNADVVVYRDQVPIVVIELKVALCKRRDVLQASGQARAYAEALGAKHYIVSAPDIAADLLKRVPGAARVIGFDDITPEINVLIGGSHVVSIADRR